MNTGHILLTLALTHIAIAIVPGPNTVIVVQNAMHRRKLGFITAAGIWPAGVIWAALGLSGMGVILQAKPFISTALYLACGSFLIWLGTRSFLHSFKKETTFAHIKESHMSSGQAFRAGVLSNLLNPKTIAYYTAVFTATGAASMPASCQTAAIIMMPTISFCWNSLLISLVSHSKMRVALDASRRWLDRIAGVVMIGFGIRLLVAVF